MFSFRFNKKINRTIYTNDIPFRCKNDDKKLNLNIIFYTYELTGCFDLPDDRNMLPVLSTLKYIENTFDYSSLCEYIFTTSYTHSDLTVNRIFITCLFEDELIIIFDVYDGERSLEFLANLIKYPKKMLMFELV